MKYSDYKAATFSREPEAKREYKEQWAEYERVRKEIEKAAQEGKINFTGIETATII